MSQVVSFFGIEVLPDKQYTLSIPELTCLKITQIALALSPSGRSTLFCEVKNNKFVVCTLSSGKTEFCGVNLCFPYDQDVTFSVTGSTPVHVTGFFQIDEEPVDTDEEIASEEEVEGDSEFIDDSETNDEQQLQDDNVTPIDNVLENYSESQDSDFVAPTMSPIKKSDRKTRKISNKPKPAATLVDESYTSEEDEDYEPTPKEQALAKKDKQVHKTLKKQLVEEGELPPAPLPSGSKRGVKRKAGNSVASAAQPKQKRAKKNRNKNKNKKKAM